MSVASWNVAFGGPALPHQPRTGLLPGYLDVSPYDVLLLQESLSGLLGEGWTSVSSPGAGSRGACVTVACRVSLGTLVPVPLDLPDGREHCAVAADLVTEHGAVRMVSLYVPWRDSSRQWLARLLAQPALQLPGVVGADLNSPVGPKPAPHPMFETAQDAGWTWATLPLLSKGSTMKASQIDHVLVRGMKVRCWVVDRGGLEQRLSDHAAVRVDVTL